MSLTKKLERLCTRVIAHANHSEKTVGLRFHSQEDLESFHLVLKYFFARFNTITLYIKQTALSFALREYLHRRGFEYESIQIGDYGDQRRICFLVYSLNVPLSISSDPCMDKECVS